MVIWSDPRKALSRANAREIIGQLNIENPEEIDIELIAAEKNAFVLESNLQGCDGTLVRLMGSGFIHVNKHIPEPYKKRFTVAHELGHFILHSNKDQSEVFMDRRLLYWYKKENPEEIEANEFAGEILMPEKMFKKECDEESPCFGMIEKLAKRFKTTLTATAIRYVTLSPFSCALISIQGGNRKSFTISDDFSYTITLGVISDHSYAADILKGQSNPMKMQKTIASAWITENEEQGIRAIYEESRVLPRYDTVLTLIWVVEEDW